MAVLTSRNEFKNRRKGNSRVHIVGKAGVKIAFRFLHAAYHFWELIREGIGRS